VPTQEDWVGDNDNHWHNSANWSAAVVPDLQTMARFDGPAAYEPALYQDQQVKGVAFEAAGWTLAGNGYTLTLGQGDLASTGAGANVVGPTVVLTADSIWTVGPDNTLEAAAVSGGGHTLIKDGAGTLTLGGADDLAALVVNAGTVRLAPGGLGTLVTGALLMDPAAALDLVAGTLIVDYTAGPNPYAEVAAWVASGLNLAGGGHWDGPGITSSEAAAHVQNLTALAVIDNNDPDIKLGGLTDLDGVPTPAESVLAKYTWYGDANLDGVVDTNDYDMINNAWLLWTSEGKVPDGGFRWGVGDFNYDGTIDTNDYDKINNAWLLQTGTLGGGGPAPTPATPGAPSEADLTAAAGEWLLSPRASAAVGWVLGTHAEQISRAPRGCGAPTLPLAAAAGEWPLSPRASAASRGVSPLAVSDGEIACGPSGYSAPLGRQGDLGRNDRPAQSWAQRPCHESLPDPNPDANAYTLGRSAAYNRMGSGAAGVWLASRPEAPAEGAWELDDAVDVLAGPAIEIPLGA